MNPAPDIDRAPRRSIFAAEDVRPTMTEKELSFHKAQAGLKAAARAADSAADPTAVDALMTAAAGPLEVCGLNLMPVTLGTLKALQAAASVFVADESQAASADEVCLAMLLFADPRRCWVAIRDGQVAALRAEAEELSFQLSLPDLRRAGTWINGQLAALNEAAGGEPAAPDVVAAPGKPAGS